MPYTSEHSARMNSPSKYAKTRRENDKFGKGIDVIWGVLDSGKTEVQAIRFDADKFTADEARQWLKDHDYKPIEFEEAIEKEDGKAATVGMEYKIVRFNLITAEETKAVNGKYGVIKGYASTFGNIDRGNDMIIKGAFVKSIDRYRQEGKLIPMCYQHSIMHPIGGFNPSKMYEDEKGLYVEGEINLDTEKGGEAYALAKQGVITDMSIGFTCDDYELESKNDFSSLDNTTDNTTTSYRKIKEVTLWEISPVVIPMNPQAKITDVKNMNFDLPIAEKGTNWDEEKAIKNIKKFTNSEKEPTEEYKKCFLYFDGKNANSFSSYKLPFVDIVRGKLSVIPHVIYSIGTSIYKNGDPYKLLSLPEEQLLQIKIKINKYYEKMGASIPFQELKTTGVVGVDDLNIDNDPNVIDNDLQDIKRKELEKILRETGRFSRKAATRIVSCLDFDKLQKKDDKPNIDNELIGLLNTFKQRDAASQENKTQNKVDEKLTKDLTDLLSKIKSVKKS